MIVKHIEVLQIRSEAKEQRTEGQNSTTTTTNRNMFADENVLKSKLKKYGNREIC
jgi:hypothetical protein